MMKEQVIGEILGSMAQLKLPFARGGGTDLSVHTEFVDAAWGTGSYKIDYEAAIFADEVSQTVYLYERTTELGSGVSFGGGGSEEYLQSGSSVYRKVKNVQFGPDGKVYEYTLNMGAIPQAVKDAAKKYGWQFKQVLSKEKAMYPVGYIPPIPTPEPPAIPAAAQAPAAQSRCFCSGCGASLPEGAVFCGRCGKPVNSAAPAARPTAPPPPPTPYQAVPQYAPVRPQTTVQTVPLQYTQPVYAGVPAQQVKKKNTGCIIAAAVTGGVVVVLVIIGIIIAVLLSKGGVNLSTANISEAYMASSIDTYTAEPITKTNVFSEYDTVIYATARMQNVPKGTKATAVWHYMNTGEDVSSEELELSDDGWIYFYIDSDTGFSTGEYYVDLLVNGEIVKTLTFTVG
ncbi:zinc ribbon domain-containing protein [Acetanaerobacterium elongatum]|uniref:Zinc-ribbon domain-containing protein n=1 Tax=Acetanaerobacterium elongatum TaxID=258515 RepID=A0A1G9URM3_9FIRM|nr:zinc ribbon domain-containing protein [Acetanaerobacterium elongatum]SDM62608.1 zinc-ribbon domain-containing protein [Acetanaerobacterium elongatum]